MIRSLSVAAAAWGVSTVVLAAALPAVAATVPSNIAALRAAVADDATLVQSTRNAWRREYGSGGYGSGQAWPGPDTIGSVGHDGRGYGYNRFSGQVYQSCMEDLGYGRVRPCDAGGR
jgi:hypothetical protein